MIIDDATNKQVRRQAAILFIKMIEQLNGSAYTIDPSSIKKLGNTLWSATKHLVDVLLPVVGAILSTVCLYCNQIDIQVFKYSEMERGTDSGCPKMLHDHDWNAQQGGRSKFSVFKS